jgi:magnesium-protoporphyrin O-methyltransferase
MVDVLEGLAARTRSSILFTFAPRTPLLTVMHNVGMLFPRGDRAPAIEPVAEATLLAHIGKRAALSAWRPCRSLRVKSGFYTSHALELVRS